MTSNWWCLQAPTQPPTHPNVTSHSFSNKPNLSCWLKSVMTHSLWSHPWLVVCLFSRFYCQWIPILRYHVKQSVMFLIFSLIYIQVEEIFASSPMALQLMLNMIIIKVWKKFSSDDCHTTLQWTYHLLHEIQIYSVYILLVVWKYLGILVTQTATLNTDSHSCQCPSWN